MPGIGMSLPCADHPSQSVASSRLHDCVGVYSGRESRPQGQHGRSVCDPGAKIALGQYGINHKQRLEVPPDESLGIHDYRYLRSVHVTPHRFQVGSHDAPDAFHRCMPLVDRLGKSYGATDRRGVRDLGHNDGDPARCSRTATPLARSPAPLTSASGRRFGLSMVSDTC